MTAQQTRGANQTNVILDTKEEKKKEEFFFFFGIPKKKKNSSFFFSSLVSKITLVWFAPRVCCAVTAKVAAARGDAALRL